MARVSVAWISFQSPSMLRFPEGAPLVGEGSARAVVGETVDLQPVTVADGNQIVEAPVTAEEGSFPDQASLLSLSPMMQKTRVSVVEACCEAMPPAAESLPGTRSSCDAGTTGRRWCRRVPSAFSVLSQA